MDGKVPADAIEDPFKDDPPRDPRLIKLTEKPCNAETPKDSLMSWITPTETFFTRNHLSVRSVFCKRLCPADVFIADGFLHREETSGSSR